VTEQNPSAESVIPDLQLLLTLLRDLDQAVQNHLRELQEELGWAEIPPLSLQQQSEAQRLRELVERLEMRGQQERLVRLDHLVHVGELGEIVRFVRAASRMRPSKEVRALLVGLEQMARQLKIPIASGPDYATDFAAWAEHQAVMVRHGIWEEIDQEHLAEELEALSRSEHDALESRLEVLITHLLKWRFDTASQEPRRLWRLTIREQRRRIVRLLHRSPSLRPMLPDVLAESYPHARLMAIDETGLPESDFPVSCSWTLSEVLDAEFWPQEKQMQAN